MGGRNHQFMVYIWHCFTHIAIPSTFRRLPRLLKRWSSQSSARAEPSSPTRRSLLSKPLLMSLVAGFKLRIISHKQGENHRGRPNLQGKTHLNNTKKSLPHIEALSRIIHADVLRSETLGKWGVMLLWRTELPAKNWLFLSWPTHCGGYIIRYSWYSHSITIIYFLHLPFSYWDIPMTLETSI